MGQLTADTSPHPKIRGILGEVIQAHNSFPLMQLLLCSTCADSEVHGSPVWLEMQSHIIPKRPVKELCRAKNLPKPLCQQKYGNPQREHTLQEANATYPPSCACISGHLHSIGAPFSRVSAKRMDTPWKTSLASLRVCLRRSSQPRCASIVKVCVVRESKTSFDLTLRVSGWL